MLGTGLNQSTAVSFTGCLKAVTPPTRSSASRRVPSARSWENTTLTEINPFTTQWCGWLRSFRSATRWWTGKVTLVPLTGTLLLPCDTPKAALIESPNTCWMISTRTPLISNQILTTQRMNLRCSLPDCPTSCSTEATVLRLVWRLVSRLTTSRKWPEP